MEEKAMANYPSYSDMVTLFTGIGNKIKAYTGAYTAKGSVAFAELPATLTASMNGYTYDVTDEFTTDARFKRGAGEKYPAGTNVTVVETEISGEKTYLFDVMSGFINIDDIYEKISKNILDIAPAFSVSEDYAVGDVVTHGNVLYKFTSAHAAGDWDANDVTETTVKELIDDAKPEPLTTEQRNALLALLD